MSLFYDFRAKVNDSITSMTSRLDTFDQVALQVTSTIRQINALDGVCVAMDDKMKIKNKEIWSRFSMVEDRINEAFVKISVLPRI